MSYDDIDEYRDNPSLGVWVTANCEEILVTRMSKQHIVHTIRALETGFLRSWDLAEEWARAFHSELARRRRKKEGHPGQGTLFGD